MARRMEQLEKEERQRVWDNMRAVAAERHAAGLMPAWFDPSMIRQEEEPINRMFREEGWPGYQSDDTWVGPPHGHQQPTTDSGGSDGPGGGPRGGGGGGWWRPEDPYWPLRDWGDHPMRWWAFGLAAVLAVGGSGTFLLSGGRAAEALLVGCGCGSLLALAAMAMSDAASLPGALGVKLAWAICVLLFAKDAWWGWQHKRRRTLAASQPSMGLCGAAALALAAGLMLTDMSALGEVALPENPGAVFKSPDVAYRNSVWSKWGYGQVQMRL